MNHWKAYSEWMLAVWIARYTEHIPFLTVVAMVFALTHFHRFTSAPIRVDLCSAIKPALTSRAPKARQSKHIALLTGRRGAPTTLWHRWTAATSAQRIRSRVSDVLYTRRHTAAFFFRSLGMRLVNFTLQLRDTGRCPWKDVSFSHTLYVILFNRRLLKFLNILINFTAFSERRWQHLSLSELVHRTSQIPFPLIFQCLPNQPSWKCANPGDKWKPGYHQVGMPQYEVRDKHNRIIHCSVSSKLVSQNSILEQNAEAKFFFSPGFQLFQVKQFIFSSVGFHCIQVLKKTENVFYIKIGRLSPNNEDACHTQLFFDNTIPTTTITSKAGLSIA